MRAFSWALLVAAVIGEAYGQDTSPYAPVTAECPKGSLVRVANGISKSETAYVKKRKTRATKALKSFLANTDEGFPALAKADDYPTVALLTSGGGLRSLLTGAGVHKAYDAREKTNYSTSGLYQAMTYEAGLSGGGWLLSSIAANNWPTITSLQEGLWSAAFANGLAEPNGPSGVAAAYAQIAQDIAAKQKAGFDASIVDPYGRLLGYQLLYGNDGGVSKLFSGVSKLSSYKSSGAPFPIITALGVDTEAGECAPPANATQYEFSPYEFGSWDMGVRAFSQIKYLGSNITAGKPDKRGKCVTRYDNMGYLFGTSSDIFPAITCAGTASGSAAQLIGLLDSLIPGADANTTTNPDQVYGLFPNPFRKFKSSKGVAEASELTLADGGLSDQNNPIWPLLYRPDVDVLLVNDNSADTSDNFPDGSEIYNTYVQSHRRGIAHRMPVIPTPAIFASQNLTTKPTFFGCNSTKKNQLAIAYLPNTPYDYNSGTSTFMATYSANQTASMISNGKLVGSANGTDTFGSCLGCLMMKKPLASAGKKLPKVCTMCFSTYCYN